MGVLHGIAKSLVAIVVHADLCLIYHSHSSILYLSLILYEQCHPRNAGCSASNVGCLILIGRIDGYLGAAS